MSWLGPWQVLTGVAIVAAVMFSALPAGAGPPPLKTFHFAIPLPKPHRGKVVLLTMKIKIPSNTTISGNPELLSVSNGPKLPCYIRAAGMTVAQGPGVWHMYVAINAPKGAVKCPSTYEGAANLGLSVQVPPPFSSTPTTVKKRPGDACKQLKQDEPDRHTHETGISLLGSSPWKEIRDRAEEGDFYCG